MIYLIVSVQKIRGEDHYIINPNDNCYESYDEAKIALDLKKKKQKSIWEKETLKQHYKRIEDRLYPELRGKKYGEVDENFSYSAKFLEKSPLKEEYFLRSKYNMKLKIIPLELI